MAYILEISQSLEEMPESERDRPLHKPSVRLLVELLRQIMVRTKLENLLIFFIYYMVIFTKTRSLNAAGVSIRS